jgi:hypothetical protein
VGGGDETWVEVGWDGCDGCRWAVVGGGGRGDWVLNTGLTESKRSLFGSPPSILISDVSGSAQAMRLRLRDWATTAGEAPNAMPTPSTAARQMTRKEVGAIHLTTSTSAVGWAESSGRRATRRHHWGRKEFDKRRRADDEQSTGRFGTGRAPTS